jgi:tetratricopeptide (TPR) repeat protein
MSAYSRALALLQSGDIGGAAREAEAGLRATPDDLPLLRLDGYILQTAGRFAEAAARYARVVAGEPGDWEIWNNLGNARRAHGDLDGSIIALRRAAALRPDLPPIQANLAAALAESGALEDALEAYRRADRLAPGNATILFEIAQLFRQLGRHEEALSALPRSAEPRLFIERGRNLAALRRLDEAAAAYRLALGGGAPTPEAWLELGIVLERAGRPDELAPLLAQAVEQGVPADSLAYLHALDLQQRGLTGEALEWARRAPETLEPVRTQRLIAKLADKARQSAAAFDAAERANALAAAEHPGARDSAAAYRASVAALADQVTPAWYARWAPPLRDVDRAAPAFLVGFPRSGTTLLDTLLMGHPGTHVLEEVPLLDAVMARVGEPARLAEIGEAEIAELRALYFSRLDEAAPPPGAVVVDKLPLNILGAPLIHRIFPDARFILALRHPCDVVLSGFMQGFEINPAMANFLDLDDSARLYDLVLGYWQHCRAILPLTIFETRYEELVVDPEATMRPLIDFLGLGWRDDLLDHRRTALDRGVISTPSYNQVTQKLYGDAAMRWERYRERMESVLPLLLPWARRLGY